MSARAREDGRLTGLINQFWIESGFAYGYRNILRNVRDTGEHVGKHRVYRLMRLTGIKAKRGYKTHPGFKGGQVSSVPPNTLNGAFDVEKPNTHWVTDFTCVRTHEGWLYVTVVIDLFSRQVIGWSMKSNPRAELVSDALLMALWRRKPKNKVLVHSDQGVPYTCSDWTRFLRDRNLGASMSRRENCHDNAMAESFFSLLKTERIKRKIYPTRNEARADIFNYIELFANPVRHHGNNDGLSPNAIERRYFKELSAV